MITTQLELSENEYSEVQTAAQLLGKSVADVLHEAVKAFAIGNKIERQRKHIDAAFGMWKDHSELPDYRKDRDEGDRY